MKPPACLTVAAYVLGTGVKPANNVLLCVFWRWVAVLHVNIIVAIGIKLASGKMKEIAIFVLNQIR